MTTPIEPPRIYPTYRYHDPARAIEWFVGALGFTERARYHDGPRIMHAELAYGSSMIMIGEGGADAFGQIVGEPSEQGGRATYMAVDDLDALFEKVEGSGVRIDEKPTERPYGSREFTCRDPEGNVWCFGTYWPKATDPA